jgi:t-SNARE complex subunit (syntaxin)
MDETIKLDGRINMLDVQIRHVDEKTDKVLKNLEELTKAFNHMLIVQESRSNKMDVIEEKLDKLEKQGIVSAEATARHELRDAQNFLDDWKHKAWSVLSIAFSILLIIGIVLFIEHNVFSKDASRIMERNIPSTDPSH